MGERVSRLIALLSEEEGALQELLQLLEEEQGSLLRQDLAELQAQSEKKQELYQRLAVSSRPCRQLVEQLAGEAGATGPGKLSALIAALLREQGEQLQLQQRRMLELGDRLQRMSAQNGQLLHGSLGTVSRSLEFFGRIFNRGTTYGGAGRMTSGTSGPRLLRGEA